MRVSSPLRSGLMLFTLIDDRGGVPLEEEEEKEGPRIYTTTTTKRRRRKKMRGVKRPRALLLPCEHI